MLALVMLVGCRPGAQPGAVLAVETPEADRDADVFVDGHYVGRVADVVGGRLPSIKLAPGVHRVEIRKPGRFPVQRTVRVDKGGPTEIVITAELLEDPQ